MRKTQLLFENFIVGFLFLFLLASSVFLFISSSTGSAGIDLFNRTIYSDVQSGLDYAYVTVYADGDVNNVDETMYTFLGEPDFKISFSVQRTFLPPSSEPAQSIELRFIVNWTSCTLTECVNITNTYDYPANTIIYSQKLATYFYEFEFPDTAYTECSSLVTIGVLIKNDFLEETILDNNFHSFTIPYCFFPPTDLSITTACIPRNTNPDEPCNTQRYWNNTIIRGGESC